MACKGRQGGFGVLPRTDQGFLESVRPWISSRHSCFYSSHTVASLHPSAWPSRAPQELHDHSNQDNFLPSQPCLPPPWLRREEEEAIGTKTGKRKKKKKAYTESHRAQKVSFSGNPDTWKKPWDKDPRGPRRGGGWPEAVDQCTALSFR